MAETTDNIPGTQDAVFTLHRGVLDRWTASPIASGASRTMAIGSGATGLLDSLTSLGGLGAGFSADAFEIASLIALEPKLASSLGAEVRALAVGDLADLVQVVLEEEEAALEEATQSLRSASASRKAAPAARKEAARKAEPRRAAPAQARRLAAVRKALAEVRRRAADVAAQRAAEPLAGAVRSDRAGELGTVGPAQARTDAFVAERPALRAAARLLRETSGQTVATFEPTRMVGSVADIGAEATTTRALRMAEGEAEMAMLAPLADLPEVAFDALRDRWVPQQTLSTPEQAPARRVQAAQAARVQTRSIAAGAPTTRAAAAQLVAQPLRGAAPAAPVASRDPLAPRALTAAEALRPPVAAETMPRPSVASMPALQGAVRTAADVLQHVARGVATHPAFRAAQSTVAAPAAVATSLAAAPALTSAPAAPAAPGARWAEWLDATSPNLRGVDAPTSSTAELGFVARERVAALGGDLGAGEWLQLAEEIEVAAPAAVPTQRSAATPTRTEATRATSTPSVRPPMSRPAASAAPAATAPRWLTPSRAMRAGDAPSGSSALVQAVRTALTESPQLATSPIAASPAWAAAAAMPIARSLESVASPAARPMGATAVTAMGRGVALSQRLLAGVEDVRAPDAWRAADPMTAVAGGIDAFRVSSGNELLSHLTAAGQVATMQGGLVFDAGAGEWLVPGEDAPVAVDAEGRPTGPRAVAAARRAEAMAATRSGADRGATATAVATAAATATTAAPSTVTARAAAASRPMVPATAAAVATVLQRFERGLDRAIGAGQAPGAGAVAFALESSGALGLLNDGVADALTPMLAARAAERFGRAEVGRRAMAGMDTGAGEMLAIGDDAPIAESAAAASPTTARRAATTSRAATATPTPTATASVEQRATRMAQQRLERALSRAGAGGAAPTLAAAMLSSREPVALRAALALFGEPSSPADDVASRFVARWMGAAEPRASRVAGEAAETVSLQPGAVEPTRTLRPTALTEGKTAEAAEPAAKVVFEGLAGLAALREMKGAGEVESTLLSLGRVETAETPAAPTAETPAAPTQAAAAPKRAETARAARPATAVRTHRFAPVGLARSRHLLGGRRDGDAAIRSVSRQTRVGYGASALGGGALLGLGPGESEAAFFGSTYASPSASMRAERLGAQIHARRATEGRAGPGRAMPAGGTERTMVHSTAHDGLGAGPAVRALPSDTATRDLVSPAAIAASVAAGQGAQAGATAAERSGKAASLARVLSVTASPTANVLPLVAPAAKAVVAKAAAKPQSESIATSGANATFGVPMAGQGMDGGGGAGSGKGGTPEERSQAGGGPQQELDALAMKIARSVLVRIKRERERRGIHV